METVATGDNPNPAVRYGKSPALGERFFWVYTLPLMHEMPREILRSVLAVSRGKAVAVYDTSYVPLFL